MNKKAIIKKIIARFAEGLELYAEAARSSRAEATHEQNKAENKYDTRGLEAGYLAQGQSRHLAEVELAIQDFEKLGVRQFGPGASIDLGALVELEENDESSFYFIGPRGGGTEVTQDKHEIVVITPQSPMGQRLMGKRVGDQFDVLIGRLPHHYRVASVC